MPYDAPDYTKVLWESGKPYWLTASGKKMFIPPLTAAQMREDPKAQAWAKSQGVNIDYQTDPTTGQVTVGPGGVTNTATPSGGLIHQRGEWNSETGQFDQGIDWGNIMALGVGGAIAAPFVAGALAGAGGGAASGAGASGAGAAAGGAAAGGTLASSTIAPLMGTLPAATAGSGAVTAATAAGGGGGWGALLGGVGGKGALVNAGANVAQSAIAAHGASEAAKTQSAAADRSLAFQQGIYDRQAQNFAPYLQQGQTSLGRLGQMAAAPGPTFHPGQPQGGFQMPSLAQMGQSQAPTATPSMQGQIGGGGIAQTAQTAAQAAIGSGGAPGAQTPKMQSQGSQSGLVLMQGPDGSKRPVPPQYVQQMIQKGARVVNG